VTVESDPLIRRLYAGALVWCGLGVALSLVVWPRRADVAIGIAGGGVLAAVSFFAIKSSIDTVLGLMTGSGEADVRRRAGAKVTARLAGRYGLLAVLAYVMIARLRLHPVGLVVGASSLVAAAAFEAARWATPAVRSDSRRIRPR
jgi:hypothetical protein